MATKSKQTVGPWDPSPQTPMPGGDTQHRLINALESNSSLYELSLELPRLAKELRGQNNELISTSETCDDIEADPLNGWEMVVLLLSMSTDTIKSIILGTVAFHADNVQAWYSLPSTFIQGAGVYVIGLARKHKDCNGEFLNQGELEQLISGLERYIQGAKVINSHPSVSLDDSQMGDKAWTMKVDSVRSEPRQVVNGTEAQFVSKPGDEAAICELIKNLKRRITKFDPTKEIRQIQSPLYVGCSTNLQERIAACHRTLRGVNKPLGLTLSVLEALGIEMRMIAKVVIRTWKPEQLPLAERLVTTLAQSLVFQTGFNDTQAGANPGANVNQSTLTYGWNSVDYTGFLASNLSLMDGEMRRRKEFMVEFERLESTLDHINWKLDQCEKKQTQLNKAGFTSPASILERLDASKEALEQRIERLNERNKLLQIFIDMFRSLDV